mgnify:CR=1 FL=1|jgi:hypothetical protein
MQNEYVIAALQLFSVVLIVALFAARIVQLRCELKEFKGWSWRKPGDNKNRVLMLLFWPVGVATCGFVVYWVVRGIYFLSLYMRFGEIIYFISPFDFAACAGLLGFPFYGLIEHMIVRKRLGDQALDLLFWAGEPPVRTSAALLDDFRNFPVTEPYIERVRGMDLMQKAYIGLDILLCVICLWFLPHNMGFVYLVTENSLIFHSSSGLFKEECDLTQLESISYMTASDNWILYFRDGQTSKHQNDSIVNAVKEVTGIEETIVQLEDDSMIDAPDDSSAE